MEFFIHYGRNHRCVVESPHCAVGTIRHREVRMRSNSESSMRRREHASPNLRSWKRLEIEHALQCWRRPPLVHTMVEDSILVVHTLRSFFRVAHDTASMVTTDCTRLSTPLLGGGRQLGRVSLLLGLSLFALDLNFSFRIQIDLLQLKIVPKLPFSTTMVEQQYFSENIGR